MASFSVPCPKCPSTSSPSFGFKSQQVPFQIGLTFKPFLSFRSLPAESASSRIQCPDRKQFSVLKCPDRKQFSVLKAAKVENSNSNSAPVTVKEPNVVSSKEKEKDVLNGKHSGGTIADEASVTAFMSQVSNLIKLVDSRDIVELQLKQSDCELMIRKKEALQPPPAPASPPPMHYATFPLPPAAPAAAPASSSPPKAVPALPSPGKASSSSHPLLKSPMAGTFYRSPAPGEPPFVKVGDKVKKGQVICIIEAMKLMNEIEADQSGTITEILIEDGKPVSLETPLFVVVP